MHDLNETNPGADAVFSRTTMVLFLCRNKSSRNGLKIYGDFLWTKRGPRSTVAVPGSERVGQKPSGGAPTACGLLGHPLDVRLTPKILINAQTSEKNPRSEVQPPQASVATENQAGARFSTLPEGEIITGGHLHHPSGHHDEEGVVHPRAEGLYQ